MTDDTTERDLSELSGDSESRILKVVLERWLEIDVGLSSQLVERWPQLRRGNGRLEAINELLKNAFEGEEATKKAAALRWRVLEAMDAYHVEGEGTDPVSFLERREKEKAVPVRRRERGEVGRLPSWGKAPSTRWVTAGTIMVMIVVAVLFGPTLFEDRSFLAERQQYDVTLQFRVEKVDEDGVRELQEFVKSNLKETDRRLLEIYEGKEPTEPSYADLAVFLDGNDLKESRENYESAWDILVSLDATYLDFLEQRASPPLVVSVEVSEPTIKGGTIFGGGSYECEAVLGVMLHSWQPWGVRDLSPTAMEWILEEMAAQPDLLSRLKMTKEQAFPELKKRVALKYFPETKQIGIKAEGTTKKESLELLHAARDAFKILYERRELKRRASAVQALRNEQIVQADLVSEHWKLMMTILGVVTIDGPAPPYQDEMVKLEKQKYRCRMDLRGLRVLKGKELAQFVDELVLRRGLKEEASE